MNKNVHNLTTIMHNIYNTPADNIKKLYWKEFDGLIDVYTEH